MTPEVAKTVAEAGPWAVVILIGAFVGGLGIVAIKTLWNQHLKADADDRIQRDRALALLETSLANNKAAIAAWDRRNQADAARHRRADT